MRLPRNPALRRVLRGVGPIVLLLGLVVPSPARSQVEVPDRFVAEVLVEGLGDPVDLALLPDGRMLVAEQNLAQVLVLNPDGTLRANAALDVPNVNAIGGERGLLALAVDPDWPLRPYLYTWYTGQSPNEIRLTRFEATAGIADVGQDLVFDPGSALHLLDGVPDAASNHNGGTLVFGNDRMLYASNGDDASECPAQNVGDLRGKILRLDVLSIGDVASVTRADVTPSDNPFVGQGEIAALVWSTGLRNPFRMTVDPDDGTLFVGDVGQSSREEVSHVETGGLNLGWPFREGAISYFPNGCTEPANFSSLGPIQDYGRTQGSTVIAGVVYRAPVDAENAWPAEYEGDFFYVDHYRGWLWRLKGSGQSWSFAPDVNGAPEGEGIWAQGMGGPVDFEIAPDGSVLWVSLWNASGDGVSGGSVRRIRYLGPVAQEQRSFGSLKSRYE